MKGLKTFIIIVVLIIVGAVVFLNRGNTDNTVEEYVEETYLTDEGLIRAYPHDLGSQRLSESLGLYMEYLLTVGNEADFAQQADKLQQYFIIEEDDQKFIRWSLDEDTSANALIDDVRIIAALKQAAEQFSNESYAILASSLKASIEEKQTQSDVYVDFYEWTYDEPASRITLSYLTDDFFQSLGDTNAVKEILLESNHSGVFFPEYYDLSAKEYQYSEEVHLVDQLLIAINREQFNEHSPKFASWLKAEWQRDKIIYGRYKRDNLEPLVTYESLSVYALAVEYLQSIEERELALEVHNRMLQLVESMDKQQMHFFDYILLELSKEKMK